MWDADGRTKYSIVGGPQIYRDSPPLKVAVLPGAPIRWQLTVASPLVVFERDEVCSVAGSLLLDRAGGTATAGPQAPV